MQQFQGTRQRIEQVRRWLEKISAHTGKVVELIDSTEHIPAFPIEGMHNDYHMDSQRVVHTEITGQHDGDEVSPATSLPKIELF